MTFFNDYEPGTLFNFYLLCRTVASTLDDILILKSFLFWTLFRIFYNSYTTYH